MRELKIQSDEELKKRIAELEREIQEKNKRVDE